MSTEDSTYKRQINEANKLGNALLSGLISEGINENRKSVKIFGSLKILRELIESYKNEVDNLKYVEKFLTLLIASTTINQNFRSLRIGVCFSVLGIKENETYQVQIEAATLLIKKIDSILKTHVKHNASAVISKEDIAVLQEEMSLINAMKEQLSKLPLAREDLKEHLTSLNNIQLNLDKINTTIEAAKSELSKLQLKAIMESADVIYFSS